MAANRDPIDIEALRIDPADPTLVPKKADKTRKKKWERQSSSFRGLVGRSRSNRARLQRSVELALFILYEHWRTGGRKIKLTNVMAGGSGGFGRR